MRHEDEVRGGGLLAVIGGTSAPRSGVVDAAVVDATPLVLSTGGVENDGCCHRCASGVRLRRGTGQGLRALLPYMLS